MASQGVSLGRAPVIAGLFASLTLHLLAEPTAAQVVTTPVAIAGTFAPAGGRYSGFGLPAVNASGLVAFESSLTGGSSNSGIFTGAPGSLQAAGLQGTAAPAGGTYSLFADPVLNAAAQVGFQAALVPGSGSGVFVGAPGSVQAAAVQGTAAPAGGNFTSFVSRTVLNTSGQVAFSATLNGGAATSGIFVGAPGSLQAVALAGSAAPAGGNYGGFGAAGLTDPVLNAAGHVAFYSTLTNGSSGGGIFAGVPGSMTAVALTGSTTPVGGIYNGFHSPVLNAAGQVAFYGSLSPGGPANNGIFLGAPGSLQGAALQGGASPAGGTYGAFGDPVLNASGHVAFFANVSGGSANSGLFAGTPGSLQPVALQAAAAPAGNGATYFSFGGFVLDASDQLAFTAGLAGTGVTSANNQGLFAGSPGAVFKIVRTGDLVDEGNGSGLHTVSAIAFASGSGGQDGKEVALNDSGELIYRLTFTDGTSGIFTSTIPVPEPSSALLTLAGLLAAIRFRKRLTK